MKKIFIAFVSFSLLSCATMINDRTIHITGEQIAKKLNEKLALPISLLKLFDVNLSNSLVTFDEASGRIMSTMDTKLSSPLFKQSLAGKLGISGKLRFDAASGNVVFDEPQVEKLDLAGAGSQYNELLNALAKTVGREMLDGLTLYTVKPEDLKFGGINYSPKQMVVTNTGLQLTLTPQR